MSSFNFVRIIATIAFVIVSTVSASAWAHSDDYFDTNPSPHGGQIRMSGPFHFELVLSEDRIVIYVSDHADQPIQTAGATAKIEITADGKTSKFDLSPQAENLLVAEWNESTSRDLIARLSVKLPGQKTQTAKFAPFAKKRK